jgi:hypothetical protein
MQLYARGGKDASIVQRGAWCRVIGTADARLWLLLRGGLLAWFSTPAPSAPAR